jgi:peptidoglycan/LPS O-acetylase OafA/YrhL
VALALGLYHTAMFGRPWRFPFANVENQAFLKHDHSAGWHGLALPHWDAFGSFFFSADYGLFAFSPVLALGAIAALFLAARGPRRREALLAIAVVAVMSFFLAGMSNWRAGWCVGPRYITTVAPFLVLPLALAWKLARERPWLSALVAGLVFPSVLLNVVSGAVYPHYPEVFDNPVFDLTFPLLGEGYSPYGLGWLLGLRGALALAPLGAVVLAAVSLGAGGDDARPRYWAAHVAAALVVAAAFLVPLSAYGRKPRAAEQGAASFVRATFEPKPTPRP